MRRALLPLILLAAALGCGPRRIPGTELEDTGDTRAIIETIARYNSSLEARDANGILALVDPAFRDNAGTLTPDDDIDIERLRTVLPQRLAKLQDVAVRIEIKTIDVDEEKLQSLEQVKTAIAKLFKVIEDAERDQSPGLVLSAAKELKPLFQRRDELLGLDAPPHMQKVELAGNLSMLLKLAQTDDSDDATDAAAEAVGCGPDARSGD